jgi:hypothetical protein
MRTLLEWTVTVHVLVIAARGVSPEGVDTVQTDLSSIGAPLAGVVWWEPRAELTDGGVRDAVAEIVKAKPDDSPETVRNLAAEQLARTLAAVGVAPEGGGHDVGAGTEGGEPPGSEQQPGTNPTTTTTLPEPSSAAATLLEQLTSAGMLTWSVQGTGAPRPLISEQPLRVVIVSGEGADEHQDDALRRLSGEMAERMAGRVVACEMIDAASSNDLIDRSIEETDVRGAFIEPLRENGAVADSLASVDALDQPFGRFALLRLLATVPSEATGAYGITPSATSAFPAS